MRAALQRFRDLTPARQAAVVAITGWNLSLIVRAQIDIHHRRDDQVRGNRRLWQLACLSNSIGPLSYFRWGRV
jgi:hypothetical protein